MPPLGYARTAPGFVGSWLAVDGVDLFDSAKAFTDLCRSGLPHPVHGCQLSVRGGQDGLEVAEPVDDLLGHQTRKPRHAGQRAEASGGYREVRSVRLAVVAEMLGQAPEVE